LNHFEGDSRTGESDFLRIGITYVASLARRHTEACVNPGLFRTAKPRPGRG
jgi:hypothetical protein